MQEILELLCAVIQISKIGFLNLYLETTSQMIQKSIDELYKEEEEWKHIETNIIILLDLTEFG